MNDIQKIIEPSRQTVNRLSGDLQDALADWRKNEFNMLFLVRVQHLSAQFNESVVMLRTLEEAKRYLGPL